MPAPAPVRPVLWVHIALGAVALCAGLGAMATKKGGRRHRNFGKAFVAAMAGVVLSALAITAFTRDAFLATIAVFSGYVVFAGYRALSQKRPGSAGRLDYAAAGLAGLVAAGMVALGVAGVLDGASRGAVLVAFGGLAFAFAAQDAATFHRGPSSRFDWLYRHVARMLGGYIATVTAVSAVNLTMLPPAVRWLWPTAVGTPLIALWIRRYQRRFEGDGRAGGGVEPDGE